MHFKQFKAPVSKIDLAQRSSSAAASHHLSSQAEAHAGEREAARSIGISPTFQGTLVFCSVGNLITG